MTVWVKSNILKTILMNYNKAYLRVLILKLNKLKQIN